MMRQMQKMKDLKNEVYEMGQNSHNMIDSLGETMNYLNNLEEEFIKMKQDALKLQQMNQQMHHNISQI